MTLADLIADANARGFRIRNLFQKESEGWQANLCDAKTQEGFIFAHGDSAEDALERAIRLSTSERDAKPIVVAKEGDIFG